MPKDSKNDSERSGAMGCYAQQNAAGSESRKRERILKCGGWKVLDSKAEAIISQVEHPYEDTLETARTQVGLDEGVALLEWFEKHLEWWLVEKETGGAIRRRTQRA